MFSSVIKPRNPDAFSPAVRDKLLSGLTISFTKNRDEWLIDRLQSLIPDRKMSAYLGDEEKLKAVLEENKIAIQLSYTLSPTNPIILLSKDGRIIYQARFI